GVSNATRSHQYSCQVGKDIAKEIRRHHHIEAGRGPDQFITRQVNVHHLRAHALVPSDGEAHFTPKGGYSWHASILYDYVKGPTTIGSGPRSDLDQPPYLGLSITEAMLRQLAFCSFAVFPS